MYNIRMAEEQPTPKKGYVARAFRVVYFILRYSVYRTGEKIAGYASLVGREGELFAGVALFLIGLLNFDTGKYCDGNTADYLSCTRPSAYYYFGPVDIILVVAGVTLILIWFLKERESRK